MRGVNLSYDKRGLCIKFTAQPVLSITFSSQIRTKLLRRKNIEQTFFRCCSHDRETVHGGGGLIAMADKRCEIEGLPNCSMDMPRLLMPLFAGPFVPSLRGNDSATGLQQRFPI